MIILLAGILLWSGAHFYKRLMPASRARLDVKLGAKKARGLISLLLALSLILMVIGFRSWSAEILYTPIEGMKHLSMLLALLGVILLGAGNSKSRLRNLIRHPMLIGVTLWAVAHLLVRGDGASVMLFGGMALWALASIFLINSQSGAWVKPQVATSLKGDIRLCLIGLALTGVIVAIHIYGFGLIR